MSMQIQVARNEFSGDPGFFGFIGKAARKIGGRIIGATPVGAAIQTGIQFARGRGKRRSLPGTGIVGGNQFDLPGGGDSAFITDARERSRQRNASAGATAQAETTLACPKGFHPNKSDYCTKAEGWIAEGTRCVRDRRRNPLNPGAASKAISRISAAKRATKALGRVTIRKDC